MTTSPDNYAELISSLHGVYNERYADLTEEAAKVIVALVTERDALLAQLPEGMKGCTIIYKECGNGHGWLMAHNWTPHDCFMCQLEAISSRIDDTIRMGREVLAEYRRMRSVRGK